MTRGRYSRKRHARGRKHKRSMSKHKSMRKHKRSMSKHKRSMSKHKRSMRRHKSRHGRKTRKLGRGDGPPGDSPTAPASSALDTWRGYSRNNYSDAQWDAHISAIVDAIENGELDEDSTTQAEYADAYREMSGR